MKRIAIALLAGVAAAVSLSQGASAADMALKAAPPPPPVPVWTGFYIGVHGGAAWQSAPGWNYLDPNAPANGLAAITGISPVDDKEGGVGGIQGGYNWQFAPNWLVGIEGDISWTSLSDHRTVPMFSAAGVPVVGTSVAMSANTEWLSSVRGKFGFIGWNTLWYATGGVAWANIEYSATATVGAPVVAPLTQSNTSFNTTKTGWVLGGGAEWMATTNVLLRVEYLYYGINSGNTASSPFNPPTAGLLIPPTYTWAKYNVQVARVGLSYKF